MPHHAEAAGWTANHYRRWCTRCDQCGKWRLVADYYEVYPPLDSEGDAAGWWFACSWCLLDILSKQLEDTMQQLDGMIREREEQHPPCKRVSVCCEEEAFIHPFVFACSICCKATEFKCLACGNPWPDPEGECLGQEDLG